MLRMGRDSSDGIATRYGLDGPGIESRWETRFFRTHPDRPWCPPSLLYNMYGAFPGVMCLGRGAGHPPSCVDVKETVELYFFSPTVPPWPVLGWILTSPFLPCYEQYGKVKAKLHSFSRGNRKSFMHQPPPTYPYICHSPLPPHSLTIPSSPSRSVHTDVGSCHQLIT